MLDKNVSQINGTVKVIFFIFFLQVLIFVLMFSFLSRVPVLASQPLLWESLLKNIGVWLVLVSAYLLLFGVIVKKKQVVPAIIDEKKLFLPAMVLVLLLGVSLGIHTAAQVIEDTLVDKTSYVYSLSFFLDEYPGHLCLFFGFLLGLILILLEINREKTELRLSDHGLIFFLAILNGCLSGIFAVEGGSVYLLAPLALFFVWLVLKKIKRARIQIAHYPFTQFLLISFIVMVVVSVFWAARNGIFVQPSELNFKILDLR
jgi:hypothetical protein